MTRAEVRELQIRLNQSGFSHRVLGEPLEEDGRYGSNTDTVYRAYLDQDAAVPTVTPAPDVPWYTSKALVVVVASLVSFVAGLKGWQVDSVQLQEALVLGASFVAAVAGLIQAVRGEPKVDPTLVARLPKSDLRLAGVRPRVRLSSGDQSNRYNPDSRGSFTTE